MMNEHAAAILEKVWYCKQIDLINDITNVIMTQFLTLPYDKYHSFLHKYCHGADTDKNHPYEMTIAGWIFKQDPDMSKKFDYNNSFKSWPKSVLLKLGYKV